MQVLFACLNSEGNSRLMHATHSDPASTVKECSVQPLTRPPPPPSTPLDVIHTVGPMMEKPAVLQSCYSRSFELVKDHKIQSVVSLRHCVVGACSSTFTRGPCCASIVPSLCRPSRVLLLVSTATPMRVRPTLLLKPPKSG